ncbi:hypothetical protein AC1031_019546 [Aphanomyces cochlioides]|nr:hypothetical protein AC1031_019546 [Aphanomyces cochlioides]
MAERKAICKTILISVVSPILIYNIASKQTSKANALLLSGIPPAIDAIGSMIRHGQADIVASLMVVSISLSALIAGLTQDPKLLLVKDSFFTCIIGTTFLVSTFWGKEDMMWTHKRQHRGPEAKEEMDAMYAKPEVKAHSKRVCRVWGGGLLIEAAIRITMIYTLSVDAVAYTSPILMVVTFTSLGIWTRWFSGAAPEPNSEKAKFLEVETNLENPCKAV